MLVILHITKFHLIVFPKGTGLILQLHDQHSYHEQEKYLTKIFHK